MKVSLRKQFWLFFILLICALLGGIILISRGILLGDFISLENKQISHDTRTAVKVIDDDLDQLIRTAKDWAIWDDTYIFMQDKNPEYIISNLTDEALISIKVNMLLYVLNDGTLVHAKGYDFEKNAEMQIPPLLFGKNLSAGRFLLNHASETDCISGLIVLPEGILMSASCPILHSDGTGPSIGSLVVGRFLDSGEVDKMRDLTALNIQVETYSNLALPPDFVDVRNASPVAQEVVIKVPDAKHINGYIVLSDGYHNPAIIVKVESPRDIYQQGMNSFYTFILIVLVLGTLFSMLFFHFLDLKVLRRVQHLSDEFTQMGLKSDLRSRVSVNGSDEISFLAQEINKTLANLENSESALKQNEERLRLLVDGAEDIIYLQDIDGKYIYFNGPTQYRLKLDDVIGKKPEDLFDPYKAEEIMADFQKVMETGEALTSEISSQLFGNDQWFSNLIYPVRNSAGEILAIGTISRNVSAYKHMEERLRFAALHDPLTGLPNRAYYMEKVAHLTDQNIGSTQFFSALLALDLDRFKLVNDTFGHPAGDELLIEVGRRLRSCLRPGDTVARLGGDEFGIVLQKIGGIQDAVQVADRIHTVFSKPVKLQGQDVFVTISIGIAMVSSIYTNVDDLLRDADIALYRAKSEGKARYFIFNQEAHEDVKTKLKLEANLRQAVGNSEFALYYQPVFSASDRKVAYLEALIRWQSPDLGAVSPGEFIPIAEETGLILPIGEWVLKQACAQLKTWRNSGYPDLQIAINISARQLNDQDLVGIIRTALKTNDLPGSALHLEIAESAALQHLEKNIEIFAELDRMGVQIDIDNFGTKYSSLNYLRKFFIITMKIDRSLLLDLSDDLENAAIIIAIITVGHKLNMRVVAEGVETEKQLHFLVEHNIDMVQGYLFCRPLPASAMLEVLQNFNG